MGCTCCKQPLCKAASCRGADYYNMSEVSTQVQEVDAVKSKLKRVEAITHFRNGSMEKLPVSLLPGDNQVDVRQTADAVHPEGGLAPHPPFHKQRERRAGAGSQAFREHLRQRVPEAASGITEEGSESDNDEQTVFSSACLCPQIKPRVAAKHISAALKENFLFKGLAEDVLYKVADRMAFKGFAAGSTILQQGDTPNADDHMYLLDSGSVEVVISGIVDQAIIAANEMEDVHAEGHETHISKHPGWVFGDIALLFNTPRTASVVARTNVTVWALDRQSFERLVIKKAPGARLLRFMRELPLLKILPDNELIAVVGRLTERMFEDGDYLTRIGERGDELYIIRHGKVRVRTPDRSGTKQDIALLGRGHIVGERAVMSEKLRSADCLAHGRVQVVVLKKRDFMDLQNPLLELMLDYDAKEAVMKSLYLFRALSLDLQEQLIARFDHRQQMGRGAVLLKQGSKVDRLFVVKKGELALSVDGEPVLTHPFIKEADGFTFFGDIFQPTSEASPVAVVVQSETLQLLCLTRRQLEDFVCTVAGSAKVPPPAASRDVATVAQTFQAPRLSPQDLEFHSVVGTGQFGMVCLVRDRHTGQQYALKRIPKTSDAKHMARVSVEKAVLKEASHRLIVRFAGSYQDATAFYLMQEWLPGGELFNYLNDGPFTEPTAAFYAACVVLALGSLHDAGIVYRDLKPENLLLDQHGYIRLVDFGFAKKIGRNGRTYTICGTPDYMAPEMIRDQQGTSIAADYWALGVLVFEMLSGTTPFNTNGENNPNRTYNRILAGRFRVPDHFSPQASDLIYKLLTFTPEMRLGSGEGGIREIKQHVWFTGMDWEALEKKRLRAPIRPVVRGPLDVSNFEPLDDAAQHFEPPSLWVDW